MHVEDWKWWQWMAIGLVLGAAVGAVRAGWGPSFDSDSDVTLTAKAFEECVVNRPLQREGRGHHEDFAPFLQDIVVHPPLADLVEGASVYLIDVRSGNKTDELELDRDGNLKARAPGGELAAKVVKAPFWHEVPAAKTPREVLDRVLEVEPQGQIVGIQKGPTRVSFWVTGVQRFEAKIVKPDPAHPDVRMAEYRGRRFQSEALVPYVPEAEYNWTIKDAPGVAPDPGYPSGAGSASYMTVLDYLRTLKMKYPELKYHYAWWDEARWTIALWTAGSAGVVGGVWPLMLWTLTGQWYRSPEERAKRRQMKLTATARRAAERAAKAKGKKAPEVEMNEEQRLLALEEELAAKIMARAAPPPDDAVPAAAPAPKVVKAFGAAKDDYYPTEVHAEPKLEQGEKPGPKAPKE